METTYEAVIYETDKPQLCKIISSQEEKIYTALSLYNIEELVHISDEIIYDHMKNILNYMKNYVQECYLTDPGVYPQNGLPVVGWLTVVRLQEEIMDWWQYVEYREEELQIIHAH